MAPGGAGPPASSDEAECLFSLELVVHNVKVDCTTLALGERPLPAVAFRLLEFPTVLLYPRPGCDDGVEECESSLGILHVSFHRGKSCLFRQSLSSLHRLLSRTPLYILLLDLRARTPLLLGSCSLSLLEAVTLLREGNLGVPAPCWRGDSGEHTLLDLMGRNVGSISLNYRLLCLGGSVVGHVGLISGQKEKITMQQDAPSVSADPMAKDELGLLSQKPYTQHPSAEIIKDLIPPMFQNPTPIPVDDGEDPLAGDTHPGPTHQQNQPALPMPTQLRARQSPDLDVKAKLEELEHETNVHCPPLLYYRNDNDRKPACEKLPGGRMPKKHIVVAVNESRNGEPEENHLQLEDHGTTKPKTDMVKVRNEQQKQDVSDLSAKPVLSHLPLLTTLLQELSILNGQLPISVETISSRLAWQYTNGTNSEMEKTKSPLPEKSRRKSSPKSKRNKGETISRPTSALSLSVEEHERNEEHVQVKPNATKGDAPSKRKLYYGLTNTFRLRLQRTNPSGLLEHERRERHRRQQLELLQQKKSRRNGLLSKTRKLQSASGHGTKEHRIPGHQRKFLDENIETLIQSNAMKAKDTFFIKQEQQTTLSPKVDRLEEKSVSKPVGPLARNLKINLPRSSRISDFCDQDDKPNSPSIPGSALSGTYRQNSRNSLNSPDGRISQEFLDSQDYTGYSDDFTSVDFTARNSDAFDSSPEPGPTKDLIHSDSERSVSSSKYNSATPSLSTPQPTVSNASPVQSYEMDIKYKRNPQIKIPLSVPYDDLSEEYTGNEAERSKSVYESSIDSAHHRQRDYSSFEDPSESEPYSYENNHSGQASKTDMSTFKSDGDLSALESSSNQHFKTDTSREEITHNQYKHISELQLKSLPGYTL